MSRARAFDVVSQFEDALCEFTGAPFCVTVDSCTNALFLAMCCSRLDFVELPKHTYVGVVQAARNAGKRVRFTDQKWSGSYRLRPSWIVDSAKRFERGMYRKGETQCVSFQAGKLLPIGRGGAILHDDPGADAWYRTARLDGRTAGADYYDNTYKSFGWHCYLDPPSAARGLWLMTYIEDGPEDSWEFYPDLSEATWS